MPLLHILPSVPAEGCAELKILQHAVTQLHGLKEAPANGVEVRLVSADPGRAIQDLLGSQAFELGVRRDEPERKRARVQGLAGLGGEGPAGRPGPMMGKGGSRSQEKKRP